MDRVWNTILGPELYHIYERNGIPSHPYDKNLSESFSGSVIKWVNILWRYKAYVSPLFLFLAFRNGSLSAEGLSQSMSYLAGTVVLFSTLLLASHFVRGMGRLMNREYMQFIDHLSLFCKQPSPQHKVAVLKYDFHFSAWPVEYQAANFRRQPGNRDCNFFFHYISGLFVRWVGVKLLYPGSVSIMQSMLATPLRQGRERLITEHGGQRVKIGSSSHHNHIDAIFIDRRPSGSRRGKKLVVCSEGNACFYEIGCVSTPLEAGYSVLGWNHPGFACSTGQPLPEQEQASVDAVMQYSINVLSFQPCDIILFAWSIGGYTASWAAMLYPEVHAVILDASFDHIKPLALFHMPQSWGGLINWCISKHLNLNNAQLLCKYPGKLALVRRTDDEVIATTGELASNRGNHLLIEILMHRYPLLVDGKGLTTLHHYLSSPMSPQADAVKGNEQLPSKVDLHDGDVYPSQLGAGMGAEEREKTLLKLAREYMVDFKATHCSQLPCSFFQDLPVLRSL